MKKFISTMNEIVDTFLIIIPIGWVLACYDGAWKYFMSGAYLQFIWHLICACVFVLLLLGFGLMLTGTTIVADKEASWIEHRRWMAFGIELLVLIAVSYKVIG